MEDELIRGKAKDGGDKIKGRKDKNNTLPVYNSNLLFLYGAQGVQYLFYWTSGKNSSQTQTANILIYNLTAWRNK